MIARAGLNGFGWSADATLVIGYGNALRGDDAAGVRAARRVGERFSASRVIVVQQLTLDLADEIAAAAQVVFIDAYAANVSGAGIRVEPVFGDDAALCALAHRADPAGLVALAKHLHGRAAKAWVVGIPAYCFALGEALSLETALRIDDAVALFGE